MRNKKTPFIDRWSTIVAAITVVLFLTGLLILMGTQAAAMLTLCTEEELDQFNAFAFCLITAAMLLLVINRLFIHKYEVE